MRLAQAAQVIPPISSSTSVSDKLYLCERVSGLVDGSADRRRIEGGCTGYGDRGNAADVELLVYRLNAVECAELLSDAGDAVRAGHSGDSEVSRDQACAGGCGVSSLLFRYRAAGAAASAALVAQTEVVVDVGHRCLPCSACVLNVESRNGRGGRWRRMLRESSRRQPPRPHVRPR